MAGTTMTYFQFLKHRKNKHCEHVPACNKSKDGECIYGKENCWFNHETDKLNNDKEKYSENEDNANIMNKNGNEVIQRIMQMMETMTKRIMYLEIKT